MFRGIVFGDFGGIDESVWVQLWSGAIGAIPAAILAAWVAVSVLKRSNRHQQVLVEQQLAVQRKEAEQTRRSIILADLLTAANGFKGAAGVSPEAVEEQRLVFERHAYCWELEGRDSSNRLELFKWGTVLYGPALTLSRLQSAPKDLRKKWTYFLEEVEADFTSSILGMGFVTDAERMASLRIMAEQRGNLALEWEAILQSAEAEISRKSVRVSPKRQP